MNGNCGILSRIFLACPTTVAPNGPNTISPHVGVVVTLQVLTAGSHIISPPPVDDVELDQDEPHDDEPPHGIVH